MVVAKTIIACGRWQIVVVVAKTMVALAVLYIYIYICMHVEILLSIKC